MSIPLIMIGILAAGVLVFHAVMVMAIAWIHCPQGIIKAWREKRKASKHFNSMARKRYSDELQKGSPSRDLFELHNTPFPRDFFDHANGNRTKSTSCAEDGREMEK